MLALLALLPGADLAQSVPPTTSASYGAYPENYQEIVTAWLNSSLTDPKSVLIKYVAWEGMVCSNSEKIVRLVDVEPIPPLTSTSRRRGSPALVPSRSI